MVNIAHMGLFPMALLRAFKADSLHPKIGLPAARFWSALILWAALSLLILNVWWFESSSKHGKNRMALVTMADDKYMRCAHRLVEAARFYGWKQDIVVLTINATYSTRMAHLSLLNVKFVETQGVLEPWVGDSQRNRTGFRTLEPQKFRKMEIFINPFFRRYERIVYMDADGIIHGSMKAIEKAVFPKNKSILLRDNGVGMKKGSFYDGEIEVGALAAQDIKAFMKKYPDRRVSGATCWFMVDMRAIEPADEIIRKASYLLCKYQSAFKFNDQTLMNLLFYHESVTFAWCSRRRIKTLSSADKLYWFCERSTKRRAKFIYMHAEKTCIT